MIRSGNVQVWLATTPVDMRRSFDGLAEHVRVFLGHDPLCGSMFVFRNKNAQRARSSGGTRTGWRSTTSGWSAEHSSSPRPARSPWRSPTPS